MASGATATSIALRLEAQPGKCLAAETPLPKLSRGQAPGLPVSRPSALVLEHRAEPVGIDDPSEFDDRSELVDQPGQNRALCGVLTGVSLGAALWVGILALVGVVKF